MERLTEQDVICSSYLYKRNKSHQWQKKWFVLRRNQLSYYKDSKEYKALKVLPINTILSINEIPDHHKFHFILVTNERIFHLKAPDEQTHDNWIANFNSLINQVPKEVFEQPPEIPDFSGTDDNFTSDDEEDTITFNSLAATSPDHIVGKGNIYRLKKRYNQWKKYYLILTNHFLFFFKSEKDVELNKIYKKINVNSILDVIELDALSKTKLHCMLIITPLKRIRFCAESEEELTKWLVYLKALINVRENCIL